MINFSFFDAHRKIFTRSCFEVRSGANRHFSFFFIFSPVQFLYKNIYVQKKFNNQPRARKLMKFR